MASACVLISDVTGSTGLYERHDTAEAAQQITHVLDRMRQIIEDNHGHCVKSQGDDTLSQFPKTDQAFMAAWAMIAEDWPAGLSVHAGMYFGELTARGNDIYGDAVNTAARLSASAKPGEILVGGSAHDQLSPINRGQFIEIESIQFKGKRDATRVFSCMVSNFGDQTQVATVSLGPKPVRGGSAEVSLGDQTWRLSGGQTLTVGRSPHADIVVARPWVSRSHASLTIRQGQLELADHSSSGCLVQREDGGRVFVHRRNHLLTGRGLIYLGASADLGAETAIRFLTSV